MIGSGFARFGWRVGLGIAVLLGFWALYVLFPGMPVLSGPHASVQVKEAGLTIFEHEWKQGDPLANGDGLGPVFNERSCAACHFQGGLGGGGDLSHNVMAFEVHPVPGRPQVCEGIVHAFAISQDCRESRVGLNDFFQVVPGGLKIVGGCLIEVRDFDPVRTESINTTALFGAGWIDRLSSRAILHQNRTRSLGVIGNELLGNLGGVTAGQPRVLPDGRIGKFGWKAQFATLKEFVASACANELGLGNPLMEQARPYAHGQHQKVNADLDQKQFGALVAFVDTLPRPVEMPASDPDEQKRIGRGKTMFEQIGCAVCHTPEIGGVTGIYSDFMLHRLTSSTGNGGSYGEVPRVPLPDDHPLPDEWKTPPLWGVADSAPYFHDGKSPSLEDAILRHSGDAVSVTKAFEALPAIDQKSIIRFLQSLKAPADAKPLGDPRSRPYLASAH
jgi:cytochrome c peroxidase